MLLAEISKGEEVMTFTDYLNSSGMVAKAQHERFEKLGAELFKRGWTLRTQPQLYFYMKHPTEPGFGNGWSVVLPSIKKKGGNRHNSGVEIIFTEPRAKGGIKMGREFYTMDEIERLGLDAVLTLVKDSAT